jgi:nucleotide-binding universal stress UspA family protein
MKTIIVPLDFSDESKTGLDMAIMLAGKNGAVIQMVHVINKNNSATGGRLTEKDKQNAKDRFEKILSGYKNYRDAGLEMDYAVEEGQIFKEITNFSDKFEDPLTVLSTHGESGFEELFIGGTAYKIISHSKNPVISTRKSKLSSNIDIIVMPLDISFQTREKVPYTVELAKQFGSEIHVVTTQLSNLRSIEKKLRLYADQVLNYISQQGVAFKAEHTRGKNLTDLTLDYSDSVKADLISIMTEQEKNPSNLLLGNYAHQMINKSFIPVLSFPNPRFRVVTDDTRTLGAFMPR